MASSLPAQHRALLLESIESGFQVKTLITPQPVHGSVVVRIAAAKVLSYAREIYNGQHQYPFPTPLVGGTSAIGHLAAVGPDATILQPGQLVFVDCTIHARDDPDALFLSAIHEDFSAGSKKLMREDLMYISALLVPYGGLRDIRLEPGEAIVVSPATGAFGGAAVQVAIAMGARVIAMGRNEEKLAGLKNMAALQACGIVDAVIDFTPPAAAKSTHLKSAIKSLRRRGRCSLMGSAEDVVPEFELVAKNITLRGKLMYERNDTLGFVKMLEHGLFPRGKQLVDTKTFELEQWKEGFDAAAEHTGIGKSVVITP
ncbi:MAG: hypothetical protein M1820_003549 [Bogoriella megaspora]|nr:MAG: hypothetical protein M1820_003549 [Bogoriella megaspora]